EAVKAGAGREEAHEAIKEHAVATVRDLRNGSILKNDLVGRLAADERLGLSAEKLAEVVADAQALTGMASSQVNQFCEAVREEVESFPAASSYTPSSIL
ncbi:MAG: adenylosuccinate lyase, partial [Opitutales bacterium]